MKNRVPRKLKKLAKKRKAIADTLTTVQLALIAAQSNAQVALVSAIPSYGPSPVAVALKTLRVVQIAMDTAKIIQEKARFKHWKEFAKWKS